MTSVRPILSALLVSVALLPTFAEAAGVAPASVTALSAIAIDGASGKILFSKDPDAARFPASTTKIMTGLLLVEHCKPDDIITAPWDVKLVKESSMHLKPFEKLRAKDMLLALMLRSANDGCYAVAVHLAGSVEKFAEMMNARAREIGCTGTHFHNPNGLNDPQHYTTAHDLALIGREAMKNPWFASVVKTYRVKIARSMNQADVWMVNHNKRLPKDPSCEGIKTGWTVPAGRCFVGSTSRDGWRAITVVLKAKDWQADTTKLTDWVYGRYEKRDQVEPDQVLAEPSVTNGQIPTVAVVPQREAYNLVPKGTPTDASSHEVRLDPVTAPVVKGQQLGELVLRDQDGFEQRIPLVANNDVAANPSPLSAATRRGGNGLWLGAAMLGGVMYLRGKTRRRVLRAVRQEG